MNVLNDLPMRCREEAEKNEERTFHPKASLSKDHRRYFGKEDDHRLPYKRDVDRIVHSKAYARYIDKTQVVYLVDNDHITHRALHVQLVSSFARGIAEVLRLNVDLVEAISLGHDVGHPPFGHEGEGYLSKLSMEYGNGPFTHPWQSCRLFWEIEPLNLGLHVYDGFLCHDGGLNGTRLAPRYGKTWEDHFADLKEKLRDPEKNIWPGTLEGCLVKLCDTLSYIGKDIEDAINLGIVKRDQVPKTFLGTTNREILGKLAADVITQSYQQDYIGISPEAYDAVAQLRTFNFNYIYKHPKLKVESKKIAQAYRLLFTILLEDLEKKDRESFIWQQFLHNKSESYLAKTNAVQKVIDYIAGMTDNYFVRTIEKLILPQRIEL
jgi:dGTPase